MNINILYAVVVLGGMGLLAGLILALAAKVFDVPRDDRMDDLLAALPGANCGGCGFAGCGALAQAMLEGKAASNACPVANEQAVQTIACILGAEVTPSARTTALVRCSGGVRAKKRFQYAGIRDCVAAMRIGGGHNECSYGCLGLGTCVQACRFGAISVVDGVAVVDPECCTGCLLCQKACPKGIITSIPYFADVNVACASQDKGPVARKVCDIGCLGCRLCVKACQHGAITVQDNLARIDYNKCTGCGDCAERCPRKLIVDSKLDKGPRVYGDSE